MNADLTTFLILTVFLKEKKIAHQLNLERISEKRRL